MNNIRQSNSELPSLEVVVRGASARIRPIILTTITTVIGVFPLTYASAIWAPLAWSIIFGLSFATVLSLVIVPILYRRFMNKDIKRALRNK